MSPQLNNKRSVYEYMEDEMTEYIFREQPQEFLPVSILDRVTEREVIKQIVAQDEDMIMNDVDQANFIDQIYREGRKLFATCVFGDQPMKYLKIMLENGLTDSKLPLGKNDFGSIEKHKRFVRSFRDNQRRFNTAFFTEGSAQKLDSRNVSIPINHEDSTSNLEGEGSFGRVYRVRIHPDHHSFTCVPRSDGLFAMKVTEHEGGREPDFHRATVGLNHPHLVKCLASFTVGTKYQMVYELASCDLEKFIKKHSSATGFSSSWLAQQLAGIASALNVVHNPDGSSSLNVPQANGKRSGYIHDIKPDNILVFSYPGNTYCLRLSDFSCAKVSESVATISGKRDSYDSYKTPNAKKGAPVYRGPESLNGALSRPYDLWSLGCVFLELLVWFVEGYDALEAFRDDRECYVVPGGIIDEGFYYKTDTGKVQLRDEVMEKIDNLSQKCQGDLKDIIDVIPLLLKIDPLERPNASNLAKKLEHLATGVVPAAEMNQLGSAAPMMPASILPTYDSDSDFGGLVRITRPSDE